MPRMAFLIAVTAAICLALAGSAAGAARLYVPAYASGPPEVVGGFERAADGSLTPVAGSPFPLYGGPPYPVGGAITSAFAPDGERAAASFLFKGGVQGLSVSAAGAVAPAGAARVTPSVTGLAVSPDGRFAYVPTRDFAGTTAIGIAGFSLGEDGSLTPLASSPYDSGEFGDVAISPDGRFLFAVRPNLVRRFAIGADGALSPLGNTPLGAVQTLNTSPDGRFLFASVVGPGAGVVSFSVDDSGNLTQNGDPALTGNTSLQYFAVAHDGRHIYMPDANLDGVVTAAVADDGKLSVIDTMPVEDVTSAAASPDGRFLYLYDEAELKLASIGADGVPELLPQATSFVAGEPARLEFQPQPAPTASFTARSAAPGEPAKFDASGSVRAFRYDWDFGDGTVLADGGPTPEHTYPEAGLYEVRLTVGDEQGCSTAQIYTGQSTTCPGGEEAATSSELDTLPLLRKLKAKPRKFAVGGAGKGKVADGTTFRYRLSERAKVKLKIQRKRGKRVATVGKLKDKGASGKNRKRFSGALRGKPLAPGSYRVSAVAKDPSGGKSERRRASFRVVSG